MADKWTLYCEDYYCYVNLSKSDISNEVITESLLPGKYTLKFIDSDEIDISFTVSNSSASYKSLSFKAKNSTEKHLENITIPCSFNDDGIFVAISERYIHVTKNDNLYSVIHLNFAFHE